MNVKTMVFIGLFLISFSSFSQFKLPNPTLTAPEIVLPENQMNFLNLGMKSLKKKTIDKTTTELDHKGNIISENTSENNTNINTTYVYKNNVLIEKNTVITSNSEAIKRENQNAIRESEMQNESTVAVAIDRNETELYKAVLDKKNHVISYSEESSSNTTATNKIIKREHQFKLVYDQDNLTELQTNNYITHYLYDQNRLVKKSSEGTALNSKTTENKTYLYDKNNNLVAIKLNRTAWYNDKIIEQINKVTDSAAYNDSNKLIWVGNQDKHFTFKYNSDNAIVEKNEISYGNVYIKQEFFYDKALMTKAVSTTYNNKVNPSVVTKTYTYNNGILNGYDTVFSYMPMIYKSVFDYNDYKKIKKITDFYKYLKNEAKEKDFVIQNETNFVYSPNAITITNKNGEISHYEFY